LGLYENPENIVFSTVSGVSSNSFANELSTYKENVYISEVVPLPFDDNTFMNKFRKNLKSNFNNIGITTTSFEGYLIGKFITSLFSSFNDLYPNEDFTPNKFIDFIYESKITNLGQITVGPYISTPPYCNQGIKSTKIIKIRNITDVNFPFSTVDTITWDNCFADPSSMKLPFLFGLIGNFYSTDSSNFGSGMESYIYGINSAFYSENDNGGINNKFLILHSKNISNYYESNSTYNTYNMIKGFLNNVIFLI